jgi:hypothetical protein
MRPNLIRTELSVYLKMREDLVVRTVASCLKRKGVEEYSVVFTIIAVFNVHIITLKRTVNNATKVDTKVQGILNLIGIS